MKSSLSLVSIIIPTYNRSSLLVETLDSIINQSYLSWECLVVDDGSTDRTLDIINEYVKKDERFKLLERPPEIQKGANGCRNFGLENSIGTYIQWFDSDDIMHKDFLKEKIETIHSESLDMVFSSAMRFVGHFSDANFGYCIDFKGDNLFNALIKGEVTLGTPLPMWRKSFLLLNKPFFDSEISQSQDLEYYSRLIFAQPNYKFLSKSILYIRSHNSSISGSYLNSEEKYISSFVNVRQRIIQMIDKDAPQVKILINQILYAFRVSVSKRKFTQATNILNTVRLYEMHLNSNDRIKLLRVRFFYLIIKTLKRGDMKFKRFLKL